MRSNAAWPGRGQGNGKPVQQQVDSLLLRLQPTTVADRRRRDVFEYVREVVQREVPGSKILPVGSFPLKTYLPYADVDMVMFTPRGATPTGRVGDVEGDVGAGSSGKRRGRTHDLGATTGDVAGGDSGGGVAATRPPALVAVNQALCTVAALSGARRGAPPHSRPWPPSAEAAKPEIRNVSFINARTPIVTMVVGNVVVDLTENQGGSVAASALLEEADNLIQRDHLFKRSLLLLKAWAWCETPRLVGKRVLGAQKGGLTSYGLSVMVLHLFALRASADTLVHPLDVLVRFFEVYSEFDWGRYCLTLDGPVPFESVRASRPLTASQGEGSTNSRLRPLVKRVLAEFYPTTKKEKQQEKEKEKEKGKPGRRGRRASRFGRNSEGRGDAASAADVGAASSAGAAAAPHFPRRDCNIQDPLNALNNLGHSVTKNNLRALERALQHGRHQLEAWQLLPRAMSSRSPSSDGPQRRPRETEGTRSGRPQGGGRGAEGRRDVERAEARAEVQDHGKGNGGHTADQSPQPAAPAVEHFNCSPHVPRNFGPPTQFVLIPPRQAGHAGASMNAASPQPMLVPSAHPQASREGQPVFVAFPQPFLQTAPHHFRLAHQPQQPYMVPQRQGQPGAQRPHSAVLLPAPGLQTHPGFSPQWQLQRVSPSMYQGDRQLGPGHQAPANGSTPPSGWRDHATTAHSEVVVAGRGEVEARCLSAPAGGERKGSPGIEKEHCRGVRRKRPEDSRDPAVQDSMLPWDLPAFVNASPTSSTASLSDFVEDCSKDGQDCQLQYESGADDEVHGGGRHASSFDGSDHSDAMVDTRQQEPSEGLGDGTTSASGNLWANWFLREFFPECCQRYASGDGFREDLLDHPCQRRSKLQEPGCPPTRRPGAPDVLQGASKDLWKSLTAVGEMLREVGPQTNGINAKEAEPSVVNGGGALVPDGGGQGGAGAVHAGVERRMAQAQRTDAVAPACTGGDRPAPSANTGGDAREMAALQPSRKPGEGGGRGRPQRAGSKPDTTEVRLQVSVDDDTGYTTSEEQGDREDAVLSTASTPPVPAADNQFPGKVSPVSTSSFAGKVGVDKGVQCSAPEPKLMVSTASQCEGPARISISAGVQCSMPAPAPPVSSCGSQCSPDIGTQASTGVQCSLLVEEELGGETRSPVLAGAGSAGSLADLSQDEGEEACDLNSDGRTVLPQPFGTSGQARLTPAVGAIPPSAGACMDDRGTAPKSRKKRRKPKATGAAMRPPAAEGAASRSPGGAKITRGGPGEWTRGLTRRLLVCGIVGFVLAAVWGMAGRPRVSGWQGSGVGARRGAHGGQESRAQPPVWAMVGGSLTLGDVLASRRPVAEEEDAGEVQWFRDGRLLPGQIRPFLTISGARPEDEGTYACFAVEKSGRVGSRALWEEATVRISEPPVVESQLQTQRLARGEMLAIIATASGVPQPEYQWRRNGMPIPGADRPMLVRHSVTEADMGTYTCDVYNVAGRAQWEEMAVILRDDGPERTR